MVRMVDISGKPAVPRTAAASGFIHLKEGTLEKIKAGGVPKGDVLAVAQTAAILAVTGSYLAFDHFFVMTGGAPASTTETILTWAYKVTFKQFHLGRGAAMSMVHEHGIR